MEYLKKIERGTPLSKATEDIKGEAESRIIQLVNDLKEARKDQDELKTQSVLKEMKELSKVPGITSFYRLFETLSGKVEDYEDGFTIEKRELSLDLITNNFDLDESVAYTIMVDGKKEKVMAEEVTTFEIKSADEKLDIAKLLPPNWKILWLPEAEYDQAAVVFRGKNFVIACGSLKEPASIYTLLHEIGHTHDEEHSNRKEFEDLRNLFLQEDSLWLKNLVIWLYKKSRGIPKIKKDLENVLRSERNAHSFALTHIKPFLLKMRIEPEALTELLVHQLLLGTYTKTIDGILKEFNIKI